jgi:hypothetical protein
MISMILPQVVHPVSARRHQLQHPQILVLFLGRLEREEKSGETVRVNPRVYGMAPSAAQSGIMSGGNLTHVSGASLRE